jgi:hypothetical protein
MLAFHRNEHPPPPQLRASVSCVAIPPLVLRGTGLGVLYGHSWPVEMSSVVTRDKQDRDWTSQFFCKRQTGFDASNHRNSMHPATEHVGGGAIQEHRRNQYRSISSFLSHSRRMCRMRKYETRARPHTHTRCIVSFCSHLRECPAPGKNKRVYFTNPTRFLLNKCGGPASETDPSPAPPQ